MTFQDRSSKEYEIVCYHCSSLQKYTLKDINNFPIRPKKNCSKCKKTIYLTIGIEGNKIVVKPIKDPIIEKLTEQLNNLKKDKVYTKTPLKESFHDPSINHALELIRKYPELPLFIYSKLYERIKKEYFLPGSLSLNEMEEKGLDYDNEFKKLTYSFYDMYIELFDTIDKGHLNQEIEDYMENILQAYGDIYCYNYFNLPFDKAKLEEVSYWTEEYAKEWLDKQLNEDNPKYAKEYDWDEEQLYKINEYDKKRAKDMVKEGSYVADYSETLTEITDTIADTIDRISRMLEYYEPLTNDMVRIIPLVFLMFDYRSFNMFDERPNEYIRGDILKLYVEMRRKKIPLGYIPCAIDYQESIDNVYDMYRKYDIRWFGMNELEKFLQYKTDPTKSNQE